MQIDELSRDQIVELKQSLLEDVLGEEPSWWDLANVDEIVSDKRVFEEYEGTFFTNDDFFCSCNF